MQVKSIAGLHFVSLEPPDVEEPLPVVAVPPEEVSVFVSEPS